MPRLRDFVARMHKAAQGSKGNAFAAGFRDGLRGVGPKTDPKQPKAQTATSSDLKELSLLTYRIMIVVGVVIAIHVVWTRFVPERLPGGVYEEAQRPAEMQRAEVLETTNFTEQPQQVTSTYVEAAEAEIGLPSYKPQPLSSYEPNAQAVYTSIAFDAPSRKKRRKRGWD